MAGLLALGALLGWLGLRLRFPPDTTPEGAYLRVVKAVNLGRAEDFFAYLETPAQHACYSIVRYRREARERVLGSYPEPERSQLAGAWEAAALAGDGPPLFALEAERRGWLARLRRDLSGIVEVEVEGERATVVTARGTRYPFRRRDNGIWGLTLFTAALVAEAEKAARDAEMVDKAAADYDRARRQGAPAAPP